MTVAAYARIAEDLRGLIASRLIRPGEQLPSELELRDKYKASRNTVLDAIKKLKDEGLVETRPGQGWFARVRIVPFVNPLSWGDYVAVEQARREGRTPRGEPPTVSLHAATPDMARRLGVPDGTAVIVRRQEWFLDGVLVHHRTHPHRQHGRGRRRAPAVLGGGCLCSRPEPIRGRAANLADH